jgi:hypothetical protein
MGLCDADGRFGKNDSQPTVVMNAEISSSSKGFIAYLAVTAAYWSFMLTDGALRMLVLLHFHTLGFSPIQLAYLFVLYEVAGMVTNLSGGWVAARFGLTSTLFVGLGLQVLALGALTQLDPGWTVNLSVVFVMLVQGASGVAKDLTKMSSKSAVKLLAPKEEGRLFRWVALLTGSKNGSQLHGFFFLEPEMFGLLWGSRSISTQFFQMVAKPATTKLSSSLGLLCPFGSYSMEWSKRWSQSCCGLTLVPNRIWLALPETGD